GAKSDGETNNKGAKTQRKHARKKLCAFAPLLFNPSAAIRNRMSFLAPAAFAFAAAIPVVIVFYLLKRKRVVKLVSSTLLWQKFLAETQASAPFQRLRHNWLLI